MNPYLRADGEGGEKREENVLFFWTHKSGNLDKLVCYWAKHMNES